MGTRMPTDPSVKEGVMGKAERRKKIIEGAARLFACKRFDEVLMDDVAQTTGVAKGTVYSYFADKEELYFAVVFDGISRLNQELLFKVNKRIAPDKKLREMIQALISFQNKNLIFFKLMYIEDTKSETGQGRHRKLWETERIKQLEAIETVLHNGAQQQLFTVRNPKTEARILRDMVRSILISNLSAGDKKMTTKQMVEMIMDIFLWGIAKKAE